MNTDIVLLAEGAERDSRAGFMHAREFIEDQERRFTRFSEESELSRLNRAAGDWFPVSADMWTLLNEALDCHRRTHGLFDPSILPQLQAAGYIQSMDEIRRTGSQVSEQPASNLSGSKFDALELEPGMHAIRLPKGMQIDLGGIAKGWIAEQAAAVLQRFVATGAVDAGGDMFLKGYPEGQVYWEVGVEDPRDTSLDAVVLHAQEGAVATSSVAKRTWKQGNTMRHHLIDPRTGEPAETPWLSVTVLAPHATAAETFAKAFLIAGEDEGRRLSAENPELTALAIDRAGSLIDLSKQKESRNAY